MKRVMQRFGQGFCSGQRAVQNTRRWEKTWRDGKRTKVALMKCIEKSGEDGRLVTGRPSLHRAILERSMALF